MVKTVKPKSKKQPKYLDQTDKKDILNQMGTLNENVIHQIQLLAESFDTKFQFVHQDIKEMKNDIQSLTQAVLESRNEIDTKVSKTEFIDLKMRVIKLESKRK
ncbi:MAG TPA: hypothetical protein P5052_01980 [Candidatus Paceibacterota bacterium]|jgi:hypothetical protein|nr:hypothetical protein [Candidatus Paceibacterota bacterium]HRZ29523.1 hypothetical protein [Candidatus Paceibacterota bacterium]